MLRKIKILIADDALLIREGLKRIFEFVDEIEVIGEAEFASEIFRKVDELKPNIVLIDLKWGDDADAGINVIRQLVQLPEIRIIAMTVYTHLVPKARQAGAHGVLNKNFSRHELIGMIKAIYENPPLPMPQDLANNPLSEREKEVLKLLSDGFTAKEISTKLFISENTARNHMQHINEKLNAENSKHAVRLGYEHGWIK